MSENLSPDITVLWAKSEPRHPLWKHLVDAAAVSLSLSLEHVHLPWDPRITALIVGMHDIGKADCEFQFRAFKEELRATGYSTAPLQSCRHERLSGAFVEARLLEAGVPCCLADAISRAVYAHHGELTKESPRVTLPKFASAQNTLFTLLLRILDIDGFDGIASDNLSSVGMILAGHIVLCDWIASNERFYLDPDLQGISEPNEYFQMARIVAEQWIHDLGLRDSLVPGAPERVVSTPRPLQQVLLDNDIRPGLVIIEAPMGEGKTEAAWILVEKWRDHGFNGMYMALPTMATSDAIFDRYREDYLHHLDLTAKAHLVHGMAWLRDLIEGFAPCDIGEDRAEGELAALWFRPTRRAMLTPHGVGTVDQAMLAGMYVKFGFLRLYGLLGRVLVIDEVHAYDAYMTEIIVRLLQWCSALRIPVVLLSATLSSQQRTNLMRAYGAKHIDQVPTTKIAYPLVTTVTDDGTTKEIEFNAVSQKRLNVTIHLDALAGTETAIRLATELTCDGGHCCVILNTVKQAQLVYDALPIPDSEKLLFHARFTAEDRTRLSAHITSRYGKDTSRRSGRSILVATQVVEQSLDVDFDFMITELAPVDLLLQRSGRLHRHRVRPQSPTLHVLLPSLSDRSGKIDLHGTGYVYAEKPLLRTIALLATRDHFSLPDDFRSLIEGCYGNDTWEQTLVPWDAIHQADTDWETECASLAQKARIYTLRKPQPDAFFPVDNIPVGLDSDDGNGWRASTRLGANDMTAIFISKDEFDRIKDMEPSLSDIIQLHRRAVKIPGYTRVEHPAPGFEPGYRAEGRLRGLVLLPIAENGSWGFTDTIGNIHEFTYDPLVGLTRRRVAND